MASKKICDSVSPTQNLSATSKLITFATFTITKTTAHYELKGRENLAPVSWLVSIKRFLFQTVGSASSNTALTRCLKSAESCSRAGSNDSSRGLFPVAGVTDASCTAAWNDILLETWRQKNDKYSGTLYHTLMVRVTGF